MADPKQGTKLEDASGKDKAKMAVLVTNPPEAEVEGQYPIYDFVMCPWCGATGYAWIDTDYYEYVFCGSCGRYFMA